MGSLVGLLGPEHSRQNYNADKALGNESENETMNGKGMRSGAPRRIRTSDTRVRSPVLYPAELWTRSGPGLLNTGLKRKKKAQGSSIVVRLEVC